MENFSMIYRGLCLTCRHHLKVDSGSMLDLPQESLKDRSKGKSSQLVELQTVYLVVHSSWKKHLSEVWVYIHLWGMVSALENNKGLGRKLIGKLVTGRSWEDIVEELMEWAKTVNIIVIHVTVHQKMIGADENFNNQIDKTTYQWILASFSVTPIIAQWVHEQSEHSGTDGGN